MGEGIKLKRRQARLWQGPVCTVGELSPGDLVGLTESGAVVPYLVLQQDYGAALNGAGYTLLMRKYILWKDIARKWNTVNGAADPDPDYSISEIDARLNSEYWQKLSPRAQSLLLNTTVEYTRAVTHDLATISRKIFLLSITETNLSVNAQYTYNAEGVSIPYISSALVLATTDDAGELRNWWTRSRVTNNSKVLVAHYAGIGSVFTSSNSTPGLRPALCISAATEIGHTPDAAGVYKLA